MATNNAPKRLIEIAPGFYNARASLKIAMGLIDIGNQMSLIKLSSGKFLVIDALSLDAQLKSEIDQLTNNGADMEAFLGTHPFHTLYIKPFHDLYPKIAYYGCPRHLKKFPEINWAGNFSDCETRNKWNPEVETKIPNGSEFVAPLPEKSNHFSCVFVYHKASKTIHCDDTIMYSVDPGFLLKLGGFKKGSMCFHTSIKGPGLLPNPEAPFQFRDWVAEMLKDWNFDNICTAHFGNKIGGAKTQLEQVLINSDKLFQQLSEKRKKNYDPNQEQFEGHTAEGGGVECG